MKLSKCIARSYPAAQRIRHFCIGDSLPPREQTWLLIKMELPCSPSSCVFNNTSTYYCSQTQISQSLNNSKCFPDQEYSNGERLILQEKCEYGKQAWGGVEATYPRHQRSRASLRYEVEKGLRAVYTSDHYDHFGKLWAESKAWERFLYSSDDTSLDGMMVGEQPPRQPMFTLSGRLPLCVSPAQSWTVDTG